MIIYKPIVISLVLMPLLSSLCNASDHHLRVKTSTAKVGQVYLLDEQELESVSAEHGINVPQESIPLETLEFTHERRNLSFWSSIMSEFDVEILVFCYL